MNDPKTKTTRRQCTHLRDGMFPLHSALSWQTVEENPTDYAWRDSIALCSLCSGMLRGWLSRGQVPLVLDESEQS